jgi:hypothetical protein
LKPSAERLCGLINKEIGSFSQHIRVILRETYAITFRPKFYFKFWKDAVAFSFHHTFVWSPSLPEGGKGIRANLDVSTANIVYIYNFTYQKGIFYLNQFALTMEF